MPRNANPDPELETELDEKPETEEPRNGLADADAPFDPWGEEEESDRRRDPLRQPV